MRSADPLRLATAALAAAGLAGCVSTQQRNARTLLLGERIAASQGATRVLRANPSVAVGPIEIVRAGTGAAFVVTLRNRTAHPLSDLPISVGTRTRRGRRYLNAGTGLGYYDTHIASLPAGGTATWVLTRRRLVASGTPFAEVGVAASPRGTRLGALPHLRAAAAGQGSRGRLMVSLRNLSGVPQYGLEVYAVALRSGRIVAAGRARLTTLPGGGRGRLSLKLLGHPAGAIVRLFAPPTIFN